MFSANSFLKYALPKPTQWIVLAVLFVNTALLPILFTYVLYIKKHISSLELAVRKERYAPIFITLMFYFMTWLITKNSALPILLANYLLGATLLSLVALITTPWFKISLHTMGIGGMLGAFLAFSFLLNIDMSTAVLSTVVLFGLIASARLKLEAHSPFEIYSGLLFGTIVMFLTLIVDLS